jgi:hypothetical protein
MPRLSQAEIRNNAIAFVHEWKDESSESAEKQSFWNEFFEVFGVKRRHVAVYERAVKNASGNFGKIDLFWRTVLLVEHKSRGQSLDKALSQAFEYLENLDENERPQFVLISDFARFRLYDLDSGDDYEFPLTKLPERIQLFGFISGYRKREYKEQDPVNIKVAMKLGELHDALSASGYTGHKLEAFLVRLVYCLFADDTGIFLPQRSFLDFLEQKTAENGSNVGALLHQLFEVLDTPEAERQTTLDDDLKQFPHVNGALFADRFALPAFDRNMRRILIEAAEFDWSKVSPAIFGSLFQSVMDPEKRRNLGAHYTSEKNILKVIHGLFLDDLLDEFQSVKNNLTKLREFHERTARLRFFDPACGSGNFLVITYREIRRLEIEIIRAERALSGGERVAFQFKTEEMSKIDVNSFYGIEYEEFPAEIARVALWLTDHLANMELSAEFGVPYTRLPLQNTPNIVHGNALRIDWREVVGEPDENLYILGNPPFVGGKMMNLEQRADMEYVCANVPNYGLLDFVCGWYVKAAEFTTNTETMVAFVSTNSITQGEQVGVLWSYLLSKGVKINFAHRTFKWSNEASGKAAVYCVIVGFAMHAVGRKRLFDYETPKSESHEIEAANINPYLVDAPDVVISRRQKPLADVPEMNFGNMPLDGGNLIISSRSEMEELLRNDPRLARYIKKFTGSDEFINARERWCLWFVGADPTELRSMPDEIKKRIDAVRAFRESSKAPSTRKFAETPNLFRDRNLPDTYLIVPSVSSERRRYVPIGYGTNDTVASNLTLIVPGASPFHFGVLTSTMHNAWMRQVCGRLKSDYRYSKDIVYNNFPWPLNPSDKQGQTVEQTAQQILDARAKFPNATMADLYDPLTMPKELLDAHRANDEAVDACYGKRGFKNELERLEFLFSLYRHYTEPLALVEGRATRRTRRQSRKG